MQVFSFQPNNSEYRKLFDSFPLELYKDEVYVDYNPFFQINSIEKVMLFIVLDEGKVLGRAAAMVEKTIVYKKEQVGLIGFWESIESIEVAELLTSAMEQWLKMYGCSYIIGPMNCSHWFSTGFSEKQNEPFFTDRFNKEYYGNLFAVIGYDEIEHYSSTYIPMSKVHLDSRFDTAKKRFEKHGIRIEEMSAEMLEKKLSSVHSFLMKSFENVPLYTPISFLEFKAMAGKVIPYLHQNFVLVAYDKDEIVGFVLAFPDLYCKLQRRIVLQIVATQRGRPYAGLGVYLTKQLHYRAKALDFDGVIHALMNDRENVSNILDKGAKAIEHYTLYGKRV